MHWIDMARKTEGIKAVFKNNVPPLRKVNIQEIHLDHRGPDVFIRFDIDQFPEDPPKKWKTANTVQVELGLSVVQSISFEGLATNMRTNIDIAQNEDGLTRVSVGPRPRLEAVVLWVWVSRISAYNDTLRDS